MNVCSRLWIQGIPPMGPTVPTFQKEGVTSYIASWILVINIRRWAHIHIGTKIPMFLLTFHYPPRRCLSGGGKICASLWRRMIVVKHCNGSTCIYFGGRLSKHYQWMVDWEICMYAIRYAGRNGLLQTSIHEGYMTWLCNYKNGQKDTKETCFTMRLDDVLKIRTPFSNFNRIGRAHVITQWERNTFTLTSCNFCISTPILTLEMRIFTIHYCQVDEANAIPLNNQMCMWSRKCLLSANISTFNSAY